MTHDLDNDFDARLAEVGDVEGIMVLIAEATALGFSCSRRRDHAGHQRAIAMRMRVKRRGGMLLLAGAARGDLGEGSALAWRRLARMSAADFEAAIERGDEKGVKGVKRPSSAEAVPQLKMTRTEWVTNAHGNRCRRIYAFDTAIPAMGSGPWLD